MGSDILLSLLFLLLLLLPSATCGDVEEKKAGFDGTEVVELAAVVADVAVDVLVAALE